MTNHEENFLEFHQANPHVYELFKKYCNAAVKALQYLNALDGSRTLRPEMI